MWKIPPLWAQRIDGQDLAGVYPPHESVLSCFLAFCLIALRVAVSQETAPQQLVELQVMAGGIRLELTPEPRVHAEIEWRKAPLLLLRGRDVWPHPFGGYRLFG
jgi:hypothetical protein